jgi:hypothetical protein
MTHLHEPIGLNIEEATVDLHIHTLLTYQIQELLQSLDSSDNHDQLKILPAAFLDCIYAPRINPQKRGERSNW